MTFEKKPHEGSLFHYCKDKFIASPLAKGVQSAPPAVEVRRGF